ncbi:hypothetical protein CONPUDRAFT_166352 [Coniophora puteana RWD-64-598 SS2]|uniref:Uncharacterized protein n=1 Tax=Coniophora puteana (strain RWD-64-598) TaxID=741705 RepID=A0A5M3MLD2_CONPW|nr:uncharacterized protein CONPUDRAFT_166352 [Coniophora puteana RWD-64-598 SS2]EIW79604.1 hypothetical protein CONPUDRAFT_166352 [Coniophora puteana RWD-64-598 SS2]
MMVASSLPAELLLLIFKDCTTLAHAQDGLTWYFHKCQPRCLLDWVQVTHVCQRWRAIALGCPSLWSHFVFLSSDWAKEILSRAGTSPLTISYAGSKRDECIAFFAWWLKKARTTEGNFQPNESSRLCLPQQSAVGSRYVSHPSIQTLVLNHMLENDAGYAMSTMLFCPTHLKRLHLSNIDLFGKSSLYLYLGDMVSLEELVLFDCIPNIDLPSRQPLRLPHLTHIHLDGLLHPSVDFIAMLELSQPLLSVSLEDSSRGLHDVDRTIEHLQRLIPVTSISPTAASPVQLDFPNHYSALRAGGQSEFGEHPSTYVLATWDRQRVESLGLISWLRKGEIPMLPSAPPQRDNDVRMSTLYETDPDLYISSRLEIGGTPDRCVLAALCRIFSLRSVVFASIMEPVYATIEDEHRCAFRAGDIHQFLTEMPSLLVLETVNTDLRDLVLALAHHKDGIPVTELQELWLVNVDFFNRDGMSQPCLSSCLATRAKKGFRLKRLVLNKCNHITQEILTKLCDLEALEVDLDESFVSISTDDWLKIRSSRTA